MKVLNVLHEVRHGPAGSTNIYGGYVAINMRIRWVIEARLRKVRQVRARVIVPVLPSGERILVIRCERSDCDFGSYVARAAEAKGWGYRSAKDRHTGVDIAGEADVN